MEDGLKTYKGIISFTFEATGTSAPVEHVCMKVREIMAGAVGARVNGCMHVKLTGVSQVASIIEKGKELKDPEPWGGKR